MTTYSFEPTVARALQDPPSFQSDARTGSPEAGSAEPIRVASERAERAERDERADRDRSAPRPVELPDLGPSAASLDEGSLDGVSIGSDVLAMAREEGRLAGIDEGRKMEAARFTRAVESVKALVSTIESAAAAREQEARVRIVVLASAIATQLLEREVRTSPEIISDLARRAIAEFPVRDTLRVHLNPSDLALLSSGLSDDPGREQLTSGQHVRWVPDPNIQSGGCMVEGVDRIVDARVSTAVERICRALVDV